jgi:EAL domain-containing protein (putative c-di-GMP-specific phosphodiesterase class I)
MDRIQLHTGASVGLALCPAHADNRSDLLRCADLAMYHAKRAGCSVAVYEPGLLTSTRDRLEMAEQLHRAVAERRLDVHYQPQLDVLGDVPSIEALVRWQHPTRGLVPPDRFIPLAEETGLVIPLGERILDRVLVETADLTRDRGLDIGINVSVVQLTDPSFPTTLAEALSRHEVDPKRLLVEVTETAVMQELETARAALQQLVDIGLRVWIDDFGTGYSSIARLSDLPVTGVKIDRRFSVGLGERARVDQLFAAITDLAHAMDLEVVVEGIETSAARARARALGCDYGQGFEFARPVPIDSLFG